MLECSGWILVVRGIRGVARVLLGVLRRFWVVARVLLGVLRRFWGLLGCCWEFLEGSGWLLGRC